MKDIVIVGTGDQARTALVYLSEDSPYRVVAFAVHRAHVKASELLGLPVVALEDLPSSHPPAGHDLLVTIGFQQATRLRTEIYGECKDLGYGFISYVSSRASCWSDLRYGSNCFIGDLVSIQPFSTLGDDVTVSSGTMIGHDASIGNHVFIGPGVVIPGGVSIGSNCLIGANATFRNGITIGDHCVIGAGALVLNDIETEAIRIPRATRPFPMKTGAFADVIMPRKDPQAQ